MTAATPIHQSPVTAASLPHALVAAAIPVNSGTPTSIAHAAATSVSAQKATAMMALKKLQQAEMMKQQQPHSAHQHTQPSAHHQPSPHQPTTTTTSSRRKSEPPVLPVATPRQMAAAAAKVYSTPQVHVAAIPATAVHATSVAHAHTAIQKPKRRKEYVMQKNRESWSNEEHAAFEQGLKTEGRNWKRLAELIPTKNVIQIRSHAQKYFLKLDKAGQHHEIPPARAKKIAKHPYPKSRNGSNKTSSYSWNKAHEEEQARLLKEAKEGNSTPRTSSASASNKSRSRKKSTPQPPAKKQTTSSPAVAALNKSADMTEDDDEDEDEEEEDEEEEEDDEEDESDSNASPAMKHEEKSNSNFTNTLSVLSSVSSLLPPASPLDAAKRLAAATRHSLRNEVAPSSAKSKLLQFPSRLGLPLSSPLSSTLPFSPLINTPATNFYKPFSHTPFLSPESSRSSQSVLDSQTTPPSNIPSPNFMMISVQKESDVSVQPTSQNEIPGRLNFDEAMDTSNSSNTSKPMIPEAKRESSIPSPDLEQLSELDKELWEHGVTSKRNSLSATSTSNNTSRPASHPNSLERADRKRRSVGGAGPDSDERDQKRARHGRDSTPTVFGSNLSAPSPFSAAYQMFAERDRERLDTTSTPMTATSDTAEWSATSSSFSLASTVHSPMMEPTHPASRQHHRRESSTNFVLPPVATNQFDELSTSASFSPLPFVPDPHPSDVHTHRIQTKPLAVTDAVVGITPSKPNPHTSFFAPLTPGATPIGLSHHIMASPFTRNSNQTTAQSLFSPQPINHAFASYGYDSNTPVKRHSTFASSPSVYANYSPSA